MSSALGARPLTADLAQPLVAAHRPTQGHLARAQGLPPRSRMQPRRLGKSNQLRSIAQPGVLYRWALATKHLQALEIAFDLPHRKAGLTSCHALRRRCASSVDGEWNGNGCCGWASAVGLKRCGDLSTTTVPPLVHAATSEAPSPEQVRAALQALPSPRTVAQVIGGPCRSGQGSGCRTCSKSGSGAASPRITRAEPVVTPEFRRAPTPPPRAMQEKVAACRHAAVAREGCCAGPRAERSAAGLARMGKG